MLPKQNNDNLRSDSPDSILTINIKPSKSLIDYSIEKPANVLSEEEIKVIDLPQT